jgi:zinc protease
VLAEIASGSFRSRANVQLRHDAGVTYGVYPVQVQTQEVGLFGIRGQVDAAEVGASLRALLAMLETLQTTPVTSDELELAKTAVAAEFERDTASSEGLASSLADAFSAGRPATSLESFPSEIARVTAADVQRVAALYLSPDDAEIVVTGGEDLRRELAFLGQVQPYSTKFAEVD